MTRLDRYLAKRDFAVTPEPDAQGTPSAMGLRFSMQKHAATRLHFDLRLEWDGVLLSWAVTKGPSLDPAEKRLAVRTEDHPLSYLQFEGTIPKDEYGGGTVMLWDLGWWQPLHDVDEGLKSGKLHFNIHGQRLTGGWALVRMRGRKASDKGRENWLMIKERDEAVVEGKAAEIGQAQSTGIQSGRDFDAIAAGGKAAFPPRRTAARPKFRKPQLATLRDTVPEGDGWWHELKLDGYRGQAAIGKGGVRIWTRSGQDWTDRFAELVPWFERLDCASALIDGEIIAGAGHSGFGALQTALKHGGPLAFQAFDLLELDGKTLTDLPLRDRREMLDGLLSGLPARAALASTTVIEGEGTAMLDAICQAGGEGLVAKRTDSPYRAGRSRSWIKVKCDKRAEFVIVGYQQSDKRGRPFSSLLLGTYERGKLHYRGKVGTGFSDEGMAELAAAMAPLEVSKSALSDPDDAPARGVRWLRPELVAEVVYGEITGDGRLRHSRYLGLRGDKPAKEVEMDEEVPARNRKGEKAASDAKTAKPEAKASRKAGPKVAGVTISSPDRVVFEDTGTTKLELARYYAAVAPAMLDETARRPLSLVRHPSGLSDPGFFQKHVAPGFEDPIRKVAIDEADGDDAEYMYVTSAGGLVTAVQMGTIEFHLWGAKVDRLDRPDRMVLDLDPDEAVGFAELRAAAQDIREHLADLGLECGLMLTGGKGVHIMVPLRRSNDWDTVRGFARTFATILAEREPQRFTATMSKARRKGRIFIDWLRNDRGNTAIAPYSVRARPGAPVAMPIDWRELDHKRKLPRFDLSAAQDRAKNGPVAFPEPQSITREVVDRLEVFASGE
ncbi:DNA ligase D [Brevirhabdus pacifica]|uniref:DNA ligase (ATP) n=1 Tax=Brevirhabdus pacifica TaxID=1267768 RepID=A0A1U7DKL4_9RHOB|nr:DNA ligase D [Brevirhabdus pacifica]APX90433.1 DNA ligase D [Brevirhabdus pacifica]OWU78547.1 ATP-dependent DNA ligase [Loktanella sp. 22II-4b]PJJ85470.1 ATP-dependent DNA ligase LigD phosphoesterase module /ATP-dependent DNA ligase LigD polymerase module [Brevirhabdus pacifica]